jgi:hypothetical protein
MNDEPQGGLDWGIKISLLLYATGAPGGGISTEGVTSATGSFLFPLLSHTENEFKFSGSVSVFAHYGSPIATFAQLRVFLDEEKKWMLEINPDDGPPVIAFELNEKISENGMITFPSVALTGIGSEMFGGYYSPAEKFDPIQIRLS